MAGPYGNSYHSPPKKKPALTEASVMWLTYAIPIAIGMVSKAGSNAPMAIGASRHTDRSVCIVWTGDTSPPERTALNCKSNLNAVRYERARPNVPHPAAIITLEPFGTGGDFQSFARTLSAENKSYHR